MPTKGKLPTAKEMEGQVLAALQELDGEVRYTCLDKKVKDNLEPLVLISEFKIETQSFYETTFANKCAQARRSLRKQGILVRGAARGSWRINKLPKPSKVRPGTSRVSNFAAEAIERLEKQRVSPAAINSILELFWEFAPPDLEPRPSNEENREVEAKAIAFIRRVEKDKGWQSPQNPNNPGFDLYRTESGRKNGKITVWCEVKGLSGKFSRVSLTKTEFEEARKRGERYWLYIVENATSKNPNLIRIKDPAGKAERFTYRHPAWRGAAEK